MTLHTLFIQYYCWIMFESAFKGIVKNVKNKTFTQIKDHGKKYIVKKSKEIS